jgi:hypothetical protein
MKFAIVILALGLFVQHDEVRLKHVKINKDISIDLPISLIPLPEAEIRQKYNTAKRPIAMYTSADRRTDFAINVVQTQWQNSDMELMQRFYRSSLYNLYDSVDYLKEEVKQVNNRTYLVFEFLSRVNPDPDVAVKQPAIVNYTYLQYTLVNGKMVLLSFTSPATQREKWQNVAEVMMESVKIKKTL